MVGQDGDVLAKGTSVTSSCWGSPQRVTPRKGWTRAAWECQAGPGHRVPVRRAPSNTHCSHVTLHPVILGSGEQWNEPLSVGLFVPETLCMT